MMLFIDDFDQNFPYIDWQGASVEKKQHSLRLTVIFINPNLANLPLAMKKIIHIGLFSFVFLLSSFKTENACDLAESTIDSVEHHTNNALGQDNLNMLRYHTYKAINFLEKTMEQFSDCGCTYAEKSLEASKENLILATKASSISGSRLLLQRALEYSQNGSDALEEHQTHKAQYPGNTLAMNVATETSFLKNPDTPTGEALERIIDASLENYKNSLDRVVETVPCKQATEFVNRVYNHCENQLLRKNLTPAKKYYNMRTKEITEAAMRRLDSCSSPLGR